MPHKANPSFAIALALALVSLFAAEAYGQSGWPDFDPETEQAGSAYDEASGEASGDDSPSRLEGRLSVGFGWANTRRTSDQPGEITLLGGSAFPGTSARIAGALGVNIIDSVGLLFEAGYQRTATTGYVQSDDHPQCAGAICRRELELQQHSIDLFAMISLNQPVSSKIGLWGATGLGVRIGVRARAEERRIGFYDETPTIPIRIAPALVLPVEAGIVLRSPNFSIPIGVRFQINPTYATTTAGRLDGDGTLRNPGNYLVESRMQILAIAGIQF